MELCLDDCQLWLANRISKSVFDWPFNLKACQSYPQSPKSCDQMSAGVLACSRIPCDERSHWKILPFFILRQWYIDIHSCVILTRLDCGWSMDAWMDDESTKRNKSCWIDIRHVEFLFFAALRFARLRLATNAGSFTSLLALYQLSDSTWRVQILNMRITWKRTYTNTFSRLH